MATPTLEVPPSPPAPIQSPETGTAAAPRRMIDIVLTAGGLLMTVVLIIAGGLLVWAHSGAHGPVHQAKLLISSTPLRLPQFHHQLRGDLGEPGEPAGPVTPTPSVHQS